MDKEFGKIIGMESVKKQLNMFYKKVQLDEIRAKNNKLTDTKRLYHMIFTGSPGTGHCLIWAILVVGAFHIQRFE